MDLSPQEIDKAKFAFSIYDFEGADRVDAFNLGDCLRALDLTPSLKTIAKLGGSTKKGEKGFTIEEFLPIYSEAKKDKDVGCLADYIEVLKCYDKHNDGLMPINQLHHILLASGEKLDPEAAQFILSDCTDGPDEDGNIKYIPFITRVCAGPVSAFDAVAVGAAPPPAPSASATVSVSVPAAKKVRPSITVDDADTPSVSFAAAKPMGGGLKISASTDDDEEPAEAEPDQAPVSFTLKAPRRSSSTTPDK